ncbi:nucleoside phosphorylase [Leeuwenhoekiella marinoflava]|uniref:Uridine phosphorylase n=2 Tax=Leeuwenhoekiella marinoflava TaxID=988 RepID=A0A4V1KS85_9FLAO|nr:nucleoside phosphorylase [Leeuwenhoekiella marinoflava]RXG28412.1 uridine phosphorylase [Leeuwenhoekiella marinoflava]SHF51223.1 uridine phosphorylase [Leeuwenhoekiella marinoflava DSM 3653]
MTLAPSELILNKDRSIYHLHLLPEQIADTIITVGDPDRVESVTKHFDTIEFSTQKREFKTQTGSFKGKRLTVISTGIGTDNIDIVLNELDALANIDFETRSIKKELISLNIIRLGTSGSIQQQIPVDSILISKKALGFDALLHFYKNESLRDLAFENAFVEHTNWSPEKSKPYCISANQELFKHFKEENIFSGITATNIGFYGPQGRKLRLKTQDTQMNKKLESFSYSGESITNLEMETSGIYGLSLLLGHKAISINAILANRTKETFSKNPSKIVEDMIVWALDRIAIL